MIIHNPILTGSFTVNGTDVASITGSAASITAINSYTASQNILNGTYATTGSNTFKNPQTINSNLIVTGSITAQTLVVQTVSSSVIYSSGSNVFGNNIANTQVFTGSMNVSGSAAFSGSITATQGNFFQTAASVFAINLRNRNANQTWAQVVDINAVDDKYFGLYDVTNTTMRLVVTNSGSVGIGNTYPSYSLDVTGTGRFTSTLLASGAATFGSSVTVVFDSGITFGSRGAIKQDASFNYIFSTNSLLNAFQLTPLGAATFASSVQSTRFYNTFAGQGSNNSRNSFQSYNLNEASLTVGWITADFGDTGTASNRVVLGCGYSGQAILAAHNGTLTAWANLLINAGGGNTGVGMTTSPSYILQVGTDSAGKPNGGSWANSSDIRLKENIHTINNALSKVLALRGVTFDWKDETEQDNIKSSGGFIADEVMLTFPNWVKEVNSSDKQKELINDNKVKSLSLPFEFDALLVEAIKELKTQNDDLQAQITELKNK
jgi:hypothetical protein